MGVPESTPPGYVSSPEGAAIPKEPTAAATTPKQPTLSADPASAVFKNVMLEQSRSIAEATVRLMRDRLKAAEDEAHQTIELGEKQRKELMSTALTEVVKAAVDTKLQAVVQELVQDFNNNFDAVEFQKLMREEDAKAMQKLIDEMNQQFDLQMKSMRWSA